MSASEEQDAASDSNEESFNPEPAIPSDDEQDGRGHQSPKSTKNASRDKYGDDKGRTSKAKIENRDDKAVKPAKSSGTMKDRSGEDGMIEPALESKGPKIKKSVDNEEEDDDKEGGGHGDDEDEAQDGEEEEDDDEEGEDEEEDEDGEGTISKRPRKRARRDLRNQFLDMEAEVDDEDEGEEDDDEIDAADPFIAGMHPDDVADLPEDLAQDDRQHRRLDAQRERQLQLDAEEEVQRLKEKYGRRTAVASDAAIVPRRLLLPSVDDPSIWGVKCKPGKEREVVYALTKRIEERMGASNQVPIISAFERAGSMAGYIYVEARKQADVLAALDGIMNVYPRTKIVLVPIKEMPDLLRVIKAEQLNPGDYVRIKRGKYGGDLAQIDEIETNGLEASLKIVPRLDYGQNEDNNAPAVDGNIKGELAKRKRVNALGLTHPAIRPPPRLFSEIEAKKRHARYLQPISNLDKKSWTYMNDTYINGFLIKDFKIQHLITEKVNPTLEEVTRFTSSGEDGTDNLDLSALAATLRRGTAKDSYLPGDNVEVYEGEQAGVTGRAISVRGDIVTMSVIEGDLRGQSIEVPTKGLRKRFNEGDHVKVIGGSKYQDEVGMVVSIQGDTVTFLSDLTLREVSVFSKDLREASDTGVAGGLGLYDIHDLVQLDAATVACVTKVDRESLRVLDQFGSARSIMPSQISNKIESRRHAVATDRNGSEIRTDDTVREIGGEAKTGVILHIYRSFLFIYNREQTEHSGISVVRTTNVATVAAKGGRVATATGSTAGPDLTKMNPSMVMQNGFGTPNHGMGPPAPPKPLGRDRAIGQTVNIRRGPHKGLLGIIKDTTDSQARVELHTKSKTVTVSKDTLGFKDPLTGQLLDYARFSASRGRGGPLSSSYSAPPSSGYMNGSAGLGSGSTNGFGSRTPGGMPDWAVGNARTPHAVASGARTPAWTNAAAGGGHGMGFSSGRTPAWSGSGPGAGGGGTGGYGYGLGGGNTRTPAYHGSRTPAYAPTQDGNRTVNPYADGSRTVNPYADGSRTVNPYAGGASGGSGAGMGQRTPAWNPTATASSYSQDAFGGGGAGSRTPAYEPSYYPPDSTTTTGPSYGEGTPSP